MQKFIF